MKNYTKEDIIRICKEQDVKFIRLQFVDIFGILKNVAVPVEQLEAVLNNEIMFDGSSIEGFVRIQESDMYLRPDLNTFTSFHGDQHQTRSQDLFVMYIYQMVHHSLAVHVVF